MVKIFNRSEQKQLRQILRKDPTPAERGLWSIISRGGLDHWRFRRQYGIGPYVVDFYCPQAKLVIEVDGDSHFFPDAIASDHRRDQFIRSQGIRIIHVTNQQVRCDLTNVIAFIQNELCNPLQLPLGKGERRISNASLLFPRGSRERRISNAQPPLSKRK